MTQQGTPNICLYVSALAVGVHTERRDMARESLMQMLEDLASRVRSLERDSRQAAATIQELEHEKRQAAATIQALERDSKQAAATIDAFERAERQAAATIQELEREKKQAALTVQGLEREVGELGAVIVLASEKVSEMLKDGASADISQPQAVDAPVESKSLERLMESSADPKKESKWRSGSAFRFD
jgi:chromosome segregation ATPase